MKDIKYHGIKPKKIIGPDGEIVFPYYVNSVLLPSGFTVTATIANGSFSGPSEILENHEETGLITANDGYSLPSSITVTGATSEYDESTGEVTISNPTSDVTIEATCPSAAYPITVSVTGGIYSAPESIQAEGTATVTISAYEGFLLPSSVAVSGADFSYDESTGVVSLSNPTGNVSVTAVCVEVDAVLENNSWETIRKVCEAGQASNYWSVGDTKTDTGTGDVVRTMRICDLSGLYGKHAVFEQVEQESTAYVWNQSSNVDDDSAYNDYNIADIRTSLNTNIKTLYSSDLQGALTQTTVKVAKNVISSTILDVTDYLFLPAEKEIFGSASNSRSEEAAVLTQYQYYSTHNTESDRIKQRDGQNKAWWLRSPYSGNTGSVCRVGSNGGANIYDADDASGVAPCFAF